MEVTAQAPAALAHPGRFPVAGPQTVRVDPWIHTYSIIAHADCEISIAKGDLALDAARLCMLVRIADRFPRDAVSLAASDGSQLAGPALHDHAILWL
jgi:hypothetical protein